MLNWLIKRVSRELLALGQHFDERLEVCELQLSRLTEQQRRSRLRSLREDKTSDDELVRQALAVANQAQPQEALPTHAKLARTARRH